MSVSVFLASPDTAFLAAIEEIIGSSDFDGTIQRLRSHEQIYPAIQGHASGVVLTDVLWNNENLVDQIFTFMLAAPRFGWGIISPYYLEGYVPPFFPIKCVNGTSNPSLLLQMLSSLAEDLRGSQVGNFQLLDFATQHYLGRTYRAHQSGTNRQVFVTMSPVTANEDELRIFRQFSSVLARNVNPAVYAIYESGYASSGRLFLTSEPVADPSLLHLISQGVHLQDRVLARIFRVVTHILSQMYHQQLAFQPLASHLITLSQQAVVKMANIAIPGPPTDPIENLKRLPSILQPLIDPTVPHHQRLVSLHNRMKNGTLTLEEAVSEAEATDIELAPEQYVPERHATTVAKRTVEKEKKKRFYAVVSTAVVSAITIFAIIIWLIDKHVRPATYFKEEITIPSGPVFLDKGKTITLPEFKIDKYEVSIGMYRRFLEEVAEKKLTPQKILGPIAPPSKTDFVPKDWNNILRYIIDGSSFRRENIYWDTPIFNIDFYDALAYAKYYGKRLPTELEWQRAAAGNSNYTYPWGKKASLSIAGKVNTGIDLTPRNGTVKAGGIDGYIGPAPVNAFKEDKTPFGVIGMAGNISEWVVLSPEFSPVPPAHQGYRGGNFEFKFVQNQTRYIAKPDSRTLLIGFRCVRGESPSHYVPNASLVTTPEKTIFLDENFGSLSRKDGMIGRPGWEAQGAPPGPTIEKDVVTEGNQSLCLDASYGSLGVTYTPSETTQEGVWIDMLIKPVGFQSSVTPSVDKQTASAFYFTEDGYLKIYNGKSKSWERPEKAPKVNIAVKTAWQRVTIYQNYKKQLWSLWLNRKPMVFNVPFANPVSSFKQLSISNGNHSAYIDNLTIGTVSPNEL